MKKMIFTAAMMLASAAAMAQSGTFQIKGNVEGLPDSLVAMIGRKTENIEVKKRSLCTPRTLISLNGFISVTRRSSRVEHLVPSLSLPFRVRLLR